MTGPSSRVPVLLVAVWLGGLLVATSVGLLAVRLVAAQVGDPAVAPLPAVAAATTSPTPAVTSQPSAPASTPPTAGAAATRTFPTTAGTLGVQCAGPALRLVYATPAQGYALDERTVSGSEAEVRFEGDGTRVRVRLSCSTGAPRLLEVRTDDRDGDGGDDD